MQCTLCNELVDEFDIKFDGARQIEDEFWHAECYSEYFENEVEQEEPVV